MIRPLVVTSLVSVLTSFASIATADEQAASVSAVAPASVAAASAAEQAAAHRDLDAILTGMKATSLRVRDMLREARRRGTKQQVFCLDEALSRSDVALRHARENGDRSLSGYARGDIEDARLALQLVSEWREAQRTAARDGFACAPGAKIVDVKRTATTVKISVDPKIPRVD